MGCLGRFSITRSCASYDVHFTHNMYVYLGVKTLKINGYTKGTCPADYVKQCEVESKQVKGSKKSGEKKELSEAPKAFQKEVDDLNGELTALNKEARNLVTLNNIGHLKKNWNITPADGTPTDEQEKPNLS